ncbi:MAG: aminotransferase class IV [Phycisphaerae bacterium]
MKELVSINGQLVAPEAATVSIFDSGFMQGIGLFETMRAYNGRIFALESHLDRLAASAKALGWSATIETDSIAEDVEALLKHAGDADARIRVTVTTGSLRLTERDDAPLTVVVTAGGGAKYPDECYTRGVTVTLSKCRQGPGDLLAGHKTTSYFARLAALREAHVRGVFEALWLTHDDHVAEGCISNVFIAKDEVLYTPPLETPVLPGITRGRAIDAAVDEGILIREAPITVEMLRDADEAFLTSSVMEIVPIVRLDRHAIGNEQPGDVTRAISEAYGNMIEDECADE